MKLICHKHVPAGYYNKLTDAWLKKDDKLLDVYPITYRQIPQVQSQYTHFDAVKRKQLADILISQYANLETSSAVNSAIEKLRQPNTFTITTGQQIHIFLGPLFFIYKITSVIRQARRLQELHPENHYVPVFWMATEDHDIAEINAISVFGKKHSWQTSESGIAGDLSTEGLETLSDEWLELAKKENLSAELMDIFHVFKKAYTQFNNLANATRCILNDLFGHYGLLIIDANHPKLKLALSDLALKDTLTDQVFNALQHSTLTLKNLGFGPQVNPRRTHFFCMVNRQRLRIDKVDGGFALNPGQQRMSENEMQAWMGNSPENVSPNALLRPVYQQLILPNVAYVCGPAELHYWHQLYALFAQEKIPVPALLLRDSYTVIDGRIQEFLASKHLDEETLWEGFEHASRILESRILGDNKLPEEIEVLKNQSEKILQMFFGVKYKYIKELREQYATWLNELEKANKRVLTDIKNQPAFEPVFNRLNKISQSHFNKKSPQERVMSWVEFLLKYKINPIDFLIENHDTDHTFGSLYV